MQSAKALGMTLLPMACAFFFATAQDHRASAGNMTWSDDEGVLRNLTADFLRDFVKKEVEVSCPTPSTPVVAGSPCDTFSKTIRELGVKGEHKILSIDINGNHALVQIEAWLGLKTQSGSEAKVRIALPFAKQMGRWQPSMHRLAKLPPKVVPKDAQNVKEAEDSNVAAELAAELAVSDTTPQPRKLLDGYSETIVLRLSRQLIAQANAIFNDTSNENLKERLYDRAAHLYQLGLGTACLESANKERKGSPATNKICEPKSGGPIIDRSTAAAALAGLGRLNLLQNNFSESLNRFKDSALLYEDLLKEGERSSTVLQYARVLNDLGQNYVKMGGQANLDEAQKTYDQGKRRIEQLKVRIKQAQGTKSEADEADEVLATTLAGFGQILYQRGQYDEALQIYLESANMRATLCRAPFNFSQNLQQIGQIHQDRGEYKQAQIYYECSLKLKEEIGVQVESELMLHNLGKVYEQLGNEGKALENYEKSEQMSASNNHPVLQVAALNSIGYIRQKRGEYKQALDSHQQSQKLLRASNLSQSSQWAETLSYLGDFYRRQNKYEEARRSYQESLNATDIGDNFGRAVTLTRLATLDYEHGNYEESATQAEQAVELVRENIRPLELLWRAHTIAGQSHRKLARTEKAQEHLKNAIKYIENLRGIAPGGEWARQRFFNDKVEPYLTMVELRRDQPEEALHYAELAKARALLDSFQNAIARTESGERLAAVQRQVQEINREIDELERNGKNANALREKLRNIEAALPGLKKLFCEGNPKLCQEIDRTEISAPSEFAELIPDSRTAALEYVVVGQSLYLFTLTRKSATNPVEVNCYELPSKVDSINGQIESLYADLSSKNAGFREKAGKLYPLLFPKELRIPIGGTLIILPDGRLWKLPFQALEGPQHRYLLEDYTIFYAPSLRVLEKMRAQRPSAATSQLLIYANPGINGAKALADNLSNKRGRPVSDCSKASDPKACLQEAVATADIIQLITHGVLVDKDPLASHIELQYPEGVQNWTAQEMMKLNLKARLTLLTACETARGETSPGEGLIGMTWALFVAGCPTTVATYWKVDATAAGPLTLGFHRYLQSGEQPAAALRKAALCLRNSERSGDNICAAVLRTASADLRPDFNHPYHWASFALLGKGY